MANFQTESRASARDTNIISSELDYIGTIQEIMKVDMIDFKLFIFDVKWFKVVCRGAQATVRKDPNGFFAVDSTKVLHDKSDTFVLPCHCEQVCFYPDSIDPKWWYVIQTTPRHRRVFEGVDVNDEILDTPSIDQSRPTTSTPTNNDTQASISSSDISSWSDMYIRDIAMNNDDLRELQEDENYDVANDEDVNHEHSISNDNDGEDM